MNIDDVFNPEQKLILKIIVTSASSLSVIATIIFFFAFCFTLRTNTFKYRLILYIAFCDLFSSLGMIFGNHLLKFEIQYQLICNFMGSVIQFFMLASICWTFVVGFTFYKIVDQENTKAVEKFEWMYSVFAWGIPASTVLVANLLDLFTDDGALWCWFKNSVFRFVLFYVPLLIVIIGNIIFCILANKKKKERDYFIVREHFIVGERTDQDNLINLFRAIIITMIICWTPAVINRIQNFIDPGKPLFVLYALQAAFTPIVGFLNAAIYAGQSIKCKKSSSKIKGVVDPTSFNNFISQYEEAEKSPENTTFNIN